MPNAKLPSYYSRSIYENYLKHSSSDEPKRSSYGYFTVMEHSPGLYAIARYNNGKLAGFVYGKVYGVPTGYYRDKSEAEKIATQLNTAADAIYEEAMTKYKTETNAADNSRANTHHKYIRKEQINGKTRYWYEETK